MCQAPFTATCWYASGEKTAIMGNYVGYLTTAYVDFDLVIDCAFFCAVMSCRPMGNTTMAAEATRPPRPKCKLNIANDHVSSGLYFFTI